MMKPDVARWVRPEIRALSAYHVPPAQGLVKLDAMENPYGWPPEVVDAWLERLRAVPLNRYPDPAGGALKEALRGVMAVPADMALMLGNGSDELIQIIAQAVSGPERVLLSPEPGFVMYRMIASFTGMRYVGVPLAADFALDRAAMLAAIEEHRPAVIFLAYPNNPTGNLFARADVEAVLDAAPGLVVLDEAYHAFADDSFMGDLGRWPNLLVMRTLSKVALAGLRLGLLAGPPAWLEEFDKLRLPYNVNSLTQASALFALEQWPMLEQQAAAIVRERAALLEGLARLPGVQVYPSRANFVLFRVPPGRADAVFQGLLQRKVLIKNLAGAGGVLADCLRVTVGTPEENRCFLDGLKEVLAA
ncbi:histidinol-phosphate transaminase [Ectothiorhodospiraceae bacterium 2226]|nr:histidinol-phosphate transaminase [Ectothiorhodospiraceae bacterium 2226]